jgi:hypothetical protein
VCSIFKSEEKSAVIGEASSPVFGINLGGINLKCEERNREKKTRKDAILRRQEE